MALEFLSPLHRATRQIGLHLEGPCAELGVSTGEGHLVAYLRSYGPCSIGELRRVFGTKRSTLTSMLDRLSRQGVVIRRTDESDRRSFQVELTRSGHRLATRIERRVEALEAEIRTRVGREDRRGFEAVMSAIAEATRVVVRPPEKPPRRGSRTREK
jgi:DNA-binding MarR family transcriptional regulator